MQGFQADPQSFQADPMGCVWTGYRSNGHPCAARIPSGVVAAAWRRELDREDVHEDRFFRFDWQGGTWLAYGLKEGGVRGVYCPSHGAEREERSFVADSRASERTSEQTLYA
jgi:hypothetical protein